MNIICYEAYPGHWIAVDDDTYDGPPAARGWGPSRAAAIADLMEQVYDEHEAWRAVPCDACDDDDYGDYWCRTCEGTGRMLLRCDAIEMEEAGGNPSE